MKFLLSLALLVTTNAFAFNVCNFSNTDDLSESLKENNIEPFEVIKNENRFSIVERKMIHATVSSLEWLETKSERHSIAFFTDKIFGDGSLAGSIKYYQAGKKVVAYAQFWPGDNEYGAFFEVYGNGYKYIAQVTDTDITCK